MLLLVQGRHWRTTVLKAKSKIYYWKLMMYLYSWPKWVSIATGKSRRGTRRGWWPYCSAVSSSQLAFLRSFSRVPFSIHSAGLCHVCSARISALHLIFPLTGGSLPPLLNQLHMYLSWCQGPSSLQPSLSSCFQDPLATSKGWEQNPSRAVGGHVVKEVLLEEHTISFFRLIAMHWF